MSDRVRKFLSCDWGTSSFRMKLVEINPFRITDEIQNNHGISSTHTQWQQSGSQQNRFDFYASIIKSSVSQLEEKVNVPLSGVPIVVSGMASSSLGMIDLPYKQLPFNIDGSDLELAWIKSTGDFNHDVIVLSGACTDVDVMRGEETQLVGAVDRDSVHQQVYIFPGTHSKHIVVLGHQVVEFKTYMTGELFAVLSNSSTLAQAVQGGDNPGHKIIIDHFTLGVMESAKSNLLNSLFTVRSRFLLQKYPAAINHSYLSGLLIGSELRDLVKPTVHGITLVSSRMRDRYETALEVLNAPATVKVIREEDVTAIGQLAIVSRHPDTRGILSM